MKDDLSLCNGVVVSSGKNEKVIYQVENGYPEGRSLHYKKDKLYSVKYFNQEKSYYYNVEIKRGRVREITYFDNLGISTLKIKSKNFYLNHYRFDKSTEKKIKANYLTQNIKNFLIPLTVNGILENTDTSGGKIKLKEIK